MANLPPTPPDAPARRARLGVFLAVLVAATALLAPPAAAAPIPYSSTPSNGWWVNGRVNAVEIVGNRLIVGGNFSAIVGSDGSTIPRAHLAAFRLDTGAPITGFRADTNGVVHTVESINGRVFAGGAFTAVNGVTRNRLVEVHPDTGAVEPFRVGATSQVLALRAEGNRLYVGGMFGSLGGLSRPKMGAIDLGTGTVVDNFAPSFNHHVRSITTLGSRIWAAGQFTTVNGTTRHSLVELSSTGGIVGARYDVTDMLWDVDVSPDGTRVFGAIGGIMGETRLANTAASFSTSSGAWQWRILTEGDVQAVKHLGGNVYFGFHEGFQRDTTIKLLAADEATGAVVDTFVPRLGGFWGVWAITGDSNRLIAGGEFRSLDAAPHNLAIFRSGGSTSTTTTTTSTTSTTSTTTSPTSTTTSTTSTTTTVKERDHVPPGQAKKK